MTYLTNNKSLLMVCLSLTAFYCASMTSGTMPIKQVQTSDVASPVPVASQTDNAEIKKAAKLFKERNFKEAIPILEKLSKENPADEQAIFGLGVALIMVADHETNPEQRRQLVIHGRTALIAAKQLGVEDFFLENDLKDLPADGNDSSTKAVRGLAALWTLHPPEIFDNEPPKGIKLMEGYRHKSSSDFEGMLGGTIWKKNGLKISYEFARQFQGEGYRRVKKSERKWLRETTVNNHKFKYVLTKTNWLVITAYANNHPIADFRCEIKTDQDVETILTMIAGLAETR